MARTVYPIPEGPLKYIMHLGEMLGAQIDVLNRRYGLRRLVALWAGTPLFSKDPFKFDGDPPRTARASSVL